MNSSPLTKDQKAKKEEEWVKEKFKISAGTTKKILKMKDVAVGSSEMKWMNAYIQNRVQGESLPISFMSNDLPSAIQRAFGPNAEAFLAKVRADFRAQNGFSPESTSEHSAQPP
jgi:hypothetical protein